MVNYLNSKPFEFGLTNNDFSNIFDIQVATPAQCAEAYTNGSADIALIPVGALQGLSNYKIISDYCIGCDGEVRTVCIFSNEKLENCTRLLLDNHSRTSFLLSQILMESYFNLDLPVESMDVASYQYQKGDAVLMIGDKVFQKENDYLYKYDLGSKWKEWTGLPFVFAVWIAKNEIASFVESALNKAFKHGIDNLSEIIKAESSDNLDLFYYFSHNIQYKLDNDKKKALDLFLAKAKQFESVKSLN